MSVEIKELREDVRTEIHKVIECFSTRYPANERRAYTALTNEVDGALLLN